MRRLPLLCAAALVLGIACGATQQPPAPLSARTFPPTPQTGPAPAPVATSAPVAPLVPPPLTTPAVLTSLPASDGVDATMMDAKAKPCDDFFQYACGGWIAKNPIPPDRPSWNTFSTLAEENLAGLRAIIESDAAGKPDPADPYAKPIGALYASCMDEKTVERLGRAPLDAELAPIATVTDVPSLAKVVARYQGERIPVLFDLGEEQDEKDATQVIGEVDQGGLGLPDRDYYLKTDPETRAILTAYRAHVAKLLELSGVAAKDAAGASQQIIDLETQLATFSMTRTEQRDPVKTYHRINLDGLDALAPDFPWAALFTGLGHGPGTGIAHALDVKSLGFFQGLDPLIKTTPPAVWQVYLRYHVTAALAPLLSKRFVDEDFHFTQILTGVKEIRPRWKRCVSLVDGLMGMAPARTFVAQHFGGAGKERSAAMLQMIEESMGGDIVDLSWMDGPTKRRAEEKLGLVANQIGYPDKWRSYDGLEIRPHMLVAADLAAAAFEVQRELGKIGKPVDRSDWEMTPPTVNAYYDPSLNEMVFPAGILQPPFFRVDGSLAQNFGGIGSVMGHELTHGFDDQGAQFDGHGDLVDWWSKSSGAQFKERSQCIAHQYGSYEIAGVHVNGELTLGENIADNGGVKIAYTAYRAAAQSAAGSQPASAVSFTPDQQFFLAQAQLWCGTRRPEYARLLVTVDPHSPERYRVNGPLSNTPAFQTAFACSTGSAMAPQDRCQVW